jgi:GAF domain-containing protein
MAVPIVLRNQAIGALNLRFQEASVTSETIALVQEVANRLALTLESARLYEDTQRSAVRERTVASATGRMRESLELEDVLRVAADEIRQALRLEEVVVRLRTAATDGGLGPDAPLAGQEGVR